MQLRLSLIMYSNVILCSFLVMQDTYMRAASPRTSSPPLGGVDAAIDEDDDEQEGAS